MNKLISKKILLAVLYFAVSIATYAQSNDWCVQRLNSQKSFPKTVPAGNYSGITHLHDDVYAVVSDKSDSALYFNFRIQINPKTGVIENVENLGFTERVDGTGFDHEAITKVSDSTIVVASEGKYNLKEYLIGGKEHTNVNVVHQPKLWECTWSSSLFYPNYVFESLAYDVNRQFLWTVPESTLRMDGEPATPQNMVSNKLRLLKFDWHQQSMSQRKKWLVSKEEQNPNIEAYIYQMDEPSTRKKAQTYVQGVSELCVLPDGQLLVLEREAFIPKWKLGAFCKCKLYIVNPLKESAISLFDPIGAGTTCLKKRLLAEWKTRLTLLGRSFANYEGMCLGPKLADGAQVLILLSDSQDRYKGVLKDFFKTIVIKNLNSKQK